MTTNKTPVKGDLIVGGNLLTFYPHENSSLFKDGAGVEFEGTRYVVTGTLLSGGVQLRKKEQVSA